MGPNPFRQVRAERLIAGGRVGLAAISLAALEVDPAATAAGISAAEALIGGFLLYALGVWAVAWPWGTALVRAQVVLHAIDLGMAGAVMGVTAGAAAPIFLYLGFALVAAALRWPWPGTLWTAVSALAVLVAFGGYRAAVSGEVGRELLRLGWRGGYLAVAALLLGYLGAQGHRLRSDVAGLATWPRRIPERPEERLRETLERTAGLLAAPRLLLAWEEPDEPWLRLAAWSGEGFETWREAPGTFEPPVAEPLAAASFACQDAAAAAPVVRTATPAGFASWRGAPLHPGLRERFEVRSVLGLALGGDGSAVSGWLFALDKPRPSADDLVLGEGVARRVETELEQIFFVERLRAAAAIEERFRLARDLHDGVIQALGGAALRLETARRQLSTDPRAADGTLAAIQDLLVAEQQDLRAFVRDPGRGGDEAGAPGDGLRDRLVDTCRRVERFWGLAVELEAELPATALPAEVAHEADRIVHEALVNAAKHGGAKRARVAITVAEGTVRVAVEDDGHGFPFRGEFDFPTLRAEKLGPVNLKQRIAAAGGTLRISSSDAGARLDIELPVR